MRIVKISGGLLLLAAIAAAGFSYWLYSTLTTPHDHSKSEEFVRIERGSTPKQVVARLADEGIISSYSATLIYLRVFGDPGKLQAGEYQFESPITPIQVLKELESGEERNIKLTIPEGFTKFDIAKRIVERFPQEPPISESEVLAMMNDAQKYAVMAALAPEANSMEGYLYPSTYSFPPDTKPQIILIRMLDQFAKVWKPEWTLKAKQLGRTPHEIVTIGSLIETESGVESERPIVASVIYNRLNRHVALGIDQTVVYIAKMGNRWDGTSNESDLNAN